ncbi:expressed unknown protein [Seminavis robusta]|uniref:SCP domain-containing protein n=1 Tax=Seminavis robusta TaxID=568900 RepID=A0A9N8F1J3_9STRA|nr:expressed unknown protein [Seminavis robusta]|eukprot:Sro2353_g324470.1 n/a (223) ;mRNA; r:8773-9546
MVLKYLQRRRQKGGQFLAFDKGVDPSTKKVQWTKADPMDIVQQQMEKERDATDTTAQIESFAFTFEDAVESSAGSCVDPPEPTLKQSSERRPTWLKRPMFSDICSNHALVNAERQWADASLHTLKRSHELDELARWHAESMAKDACTYHADPNVLCSKLAHLPQVRLGENVAKGKSVRVLHSTMKKHAANYANMMDSRFTELGMATARCANGDWYLCQIFRG